MEKTREELGEGEKKLVSAKLKHESGKKLFSEKKAREGEVLERLKSAASQRTRMEKLGGGVNALAKLHNSITEAQAVLRGELVQAVNQAAEMLWPQLYPYGDFKSIRLNAGEDDYSVELLANTGEWTAVEHASGGERTCASLSLRISFAVVLTPNLSWLVLDEPTHNLDASAVRSLCRALREEIPKIVEQTFIITHDEALKEGANAAIYKVERDKDAGDKSTVEMLEAG